MGNAKGKFIAAAALIICCAVIFMIVKLAFMPAAAEVKITSEGAAVEWEEQEGAVSYNLYRKTGDGIWELIAAGLDQTSYTDEDVSPQNTYSYSVQAYLTSGIKSAFSTDEENSFVYAEMPEMTLAENTAQGAYIEWNEIVDAASYIIYRKTSGSAWKRIDEDITETCYTDEAADSGTVYKYTVRAVYDDGSEGTLDPDGIEISFLAAPVMKEAGADEDSIEISWEETEGAESYIVYRMDEDSKDWEEIAQTSGTSYDDEDVEDGAEYTYAVCAAGEDGAVSALSQQSVSAVFSKKASGTDQTSSGSSSSSSSSSSTSSSSAIESPVSDDEPYVRASGYYQISYSISYSAGYDLSVSDYNMGLKVIKVKEYLVEQGLLAKTWDKATDAWTLYDSDTAAAVSKFQTNNGLEATGVVDEETWLAMGFTESDWTGLGAYVTPVKVNSQSTRSDYIDAMVSTAQSYLNAGTTYGGGCSGSPGSAADCSGLVIQCLYAAGINPTSVTVVSHSQSTHLYGSRDLGNDSKLGITVSSPERGDLVFYYNSSGVISHVALYVGDGYVIESVAYKGVVKRSMWSSGSSHKYVRVFW